LEGSEDAEKRFDHGGDEWLRSRIDSLTPSNGFLFLLSSGCSLFDHLLRASVVNGFFPRNTRKARKKKRGEIIYIPISFLLSLVLSVCSATSVVNYSGFSRSIAEEKVNLGGLSGRGEEKWSKVFSTRIVFGVVWVLSDRFRAFRVFRGQKGFLTAKYTKEEKKFISIQFSSYSSLVFSVPSASSAVNCSGLFSVFYTIGYQQR